MVKIAQKDFKIHIHVKLSGKQRFLLLKNPSQNRKNYAEAIRAFQLQKNIPQEQVSYLFFFPLEFILRTMSCKNLLRHMCIPEQIFEFRKNSFHVAFLMRK